MTNEKLTEYILSEIRHRVNESYKTDIDTGEHKDATPIDYIDWAIEEFEENQAMLEDIPY